MRLKIITGILLTCIIFNIVNPKEILANTRQKESFESISSKEGLSSEYITVIFQDSKGYIWIGTSDGLNRYDGKNIKIYNCDINDNNSLSSTYITALAEDVYGNIWIGTDAGLDILIRETDTIIRAKEMALKKDFQKNYRVTSLLHSKENSNIMWIGTEDGLIKANIKEPKRNKFYRAKDDINSLTHSSITFLEKDNHNRLWIGTKAGINVLDTESDTIYKKDEVNGDRLFIYNIEKDNLGDMWITTKEGVLYYKQDSDKVENFNINIENKVISNIHAIISDSKDNIWISSSDGIVMHSKTDHTNRLLKSDINRKNHLTSNSITCFYEDRNGVIWIGTDRGINILNNNNQFKFIGNLDNTSNILSGDNIVSILEGKHGYIWVATKFNGINILDKNMKLIKKLSYEPESKLESTNKIGNHIKSLHKNNKGEIIVITTKGVAVFNVDNYSVNKYILIDSYISELSYIYDDENVTWISSTSQLYNSDNKTREFNLFNNELIKSNINPGSITYIYPDNKDKNILWLGGNDTGLVKYHKTKGVISNYLNDTKNKNSIISNNINCIIGDDFGSLWIGTNIGLSKFNIESETFESYTTADGITNNFINSILIDDNNDLWISTNKGLNKYSIKTNKFINFTEIDVLDGIQFNVNSSLKTSDGKMIFGSTNGLTYFNPNEIINPEKNNENVIVDDIYEGENKISYDGNEIILDHNYDDLSINYFLPNYRNINNVTYEYMLEGIDSKWIYADSKNYVNYKSLDPGRYIFKVRARDVHGNMTEETSINIRVKNPIWKTPLAYFIYLVILLVISYSILNYVKILQKLVSQKTINLNKQLEENKRLSEEIIKQEKFKNSYFVNLSHELRTPINVIMSTVQLINTFNKDKTMTNEKYKGYMNIISKNCDSLLNIINDIIDSSKIETGQYKIYKKDADIVYIVEEAALNMSKFIEDKGLSLVIDPDMEEQIIYCDEIEIERCIVNLLGNAVKFTPEGGKITVYIKEINDNIEITIEDTGIGISKEDQEFIFKRFSQVEGTGATKASSSGIGLTLVKHVAELHGGHVKLESELNKGSRFTIVLPNISEQTLDSNENI